MKVFGERIKKLRVEANLTQAEVSKALNMTRNVITHYEKGIREPSLETLKKICQFFDVSADYLLGLED